MNFSSKRTGETVTLTFNLDRLLDDGETIDTADIAVTARISRAGATEDPAPEDIKLGAEAIDGRKVHQSVTGGVAGNEYLMLLTVTTPSRVLQEVAILPIQGV